MNEYCINRINHLKKNASYLYNRNSNQLEKNKMKKLLLTITTLAIIGLSNLVNAQAPNWLWAKSSGGNTDEEALSNSTDASGNLIVTGYFYSSAVTFGTTTLTNNGSGDMFIVKYDPLGNVIWAKSVGGVGYDVANSITVDPFGNLIVAGYFNSPTITFGNTTLTNAGNNDAFIVKYDATGTVIWAKSVGENGADQAFSTTTDLSGNIMVTGSFNSSNITFGTIILTNALSGTDNMFIAKYDPSGTVIWAKQAGWAGYDYATSVTADAFGNIIVLGYFNSADITFGTITLNNAGSYDIFMVKYDAAGTLLWANSAGGTGSDFSSSVTADASGNLIVIGRFQNSTITFDTITLTNVGNSDIFIVKYNSLGTVLWAKSAGGSGGDFAGKVISDATGNIIVAGKFYSPTISFGTNTLTNSNPGYNDIFIVKYDQVGTVLWAKSEGGSGDDGANTIAADTSGNLIVAGTFNSSNITFGSNTLMNASSSGSADMFIAKLGNITGIEGNDNSNSISAYPNPVVTELAITNRQWANKTVTVTVSAYDVMGNVKLQQNITATEGKLKLDVSSLLSGLYFLRVEENGKVYNTKFVKAL